jgi:hypothetical protein
MWISTDGAWTFDRIKDTDSDTREGLNFLFVGGFALTIVAIIGVLFDSQAIVSLPATFWSRPVS